MSTRFCYLLQHDYIILTFSQGTGSGRAQEVGRRGEGVHGLEIGQPGVIALFLFYMYFCTMYCISGAKERCLVMACRTVAIPAMINAVEFGWGSLSHLHDT